MDYFRFSCPDSSEFPTNKCSYNGKTYNIGDVLRDGTGPPCRASCRCENRTHTVATIQCAHIECPEDDEPVIVRRYNDLESCCASGGKWFSSSYYGS